VCPLHYILVDRIDFLPEILSGGILEGSGWIDVSRDLEDACADCGEDSFDDSDDAVVERVHSAARFGFANAASYQRLDVPRLDLHVDRRPFPYDLERFNKSWNARPVGQGELAELLFRQLCDCLLRGPLRMPGMDDRIVMNHDDPVASRVDIELDGVGSELDGALERSDRILRMRLVSPTMRDQLGRITAST
jgi:hypothetical protein